MLTFILVVVLGGGVALLAISLAESDQPATDPPEPDRGDDSEPLLASVPETPPDPEPEDEPEPAPQPELVAVSAGPAELPRPGRDPVPAQFTAVEGRYADVAHAPLWRRVLALVGIVLITITFGVGFAAVLGAIIAAVAEVLSNAIG